MSNAASSSASSAAWPTQSVPLMDIVLDDENSRLGQTDGMTQEELRTLLIENEEVIPLAIGIAKHGGLYPNDLPLVMAKGKKWVVLEGNRRVCACQILCHPDLLTKAQRGRIPPISPNLRRQLSVINVVVAPTRKAAQPVIASLHTKEGRKRWSAVARSMHIARRADDGIAPAEIAEETDMPLAAVKKALLAYRLLAIVRSDSTLTSAQKAIANDIKLRLNPFARFFESKEASPLFPFRIDDEGGLIHDGLSREEAKIVVRQIAQMYLFPAHGSEAPLFDTRSDEGQVINHAKSMDGYFKRIAERREREVAPEPDSTAIASQPAPELSSSQPTTHGGINASHPQVASPISNGPHPPAATPKIPRQKQPVFFSGLRSGAVTDPALLEVVREISDINHNKYPTAAIYLMRALVEACLTHAIKRKKLWADFIATHTPNYGLGDLTDYARRRRDDIFLEPIRAKALIDQWSKYKFIADKTVHVIIKGTPSLADQAASEIRHLVDGIIDGTALIS